MNKLIKITASLILSCSLLLCPKNTIDIKVSVNFVQSDCLVITLPNNNNSYFIQDGYVFGFHYEMLIAYCQQIDRKPIFIVENNVGARLKMLKEKKADIAVLESSVEDIYLSPYFLCSDNFTKNRENACWVANKSNHLLIRDINNWFDNFKSNKEYVRLEWRYFDKNSQYQQSKNLSEYDDLIKKYSEKINWDWRLVSSLIYQESNFKSGLRSHTGATGLMQIRQATANQMGYPNVTNNETNIAAGTKLLQYLENYFTNDSISNEELQKIVLAAYNSGHGRVQTLQRYTKSQEKNPNIWKEIEYVTSRKYQPNGDILLKKPKLASETAKFVDEILIRYQHYKNIFRD